METINHFPHSWGKEKKNEKLKFYPFSRKEFLDDFTKKLFELKEKNKKEAIKLVQTFRQLDSIIAEYKRIYKQMEDAVKDAQEEKKQKKQLEPAEMQELQKRIDQWDYLRRVTHEQLVKRYYQFILDYEKYLQEKFPWLDPDIFDKKGDIQPQFIQYNSEGKGTMDTREIPKNVKETIGAWAMKMMEEKEKPEDSEEPGQLEALENLLQNEYKELDKKSKKLHLSS